MWGHITPVCSWFGWFWLPPALFYAETWSKTTTKCLKSTTDNRGQLKTTADGSNVRGWQRTINCKSNQTKPCHGWHRQSPSRCLGPRPKLELHELVDCWDMLLSQARWAWVSLHQAPTPSLFREPRLLASRFQTHLWCLNPQCICWQPKIFSRVNKKNTTLCTR